MRNIKLTIEYDGTNYHGWQIQPNGITVQEAIQNALTTLTKVESRITGAGRTDSGVHAAGQVANFETNSKMSAQVLQKGLNSLLPEDIVIVNAVDVPLEFHARFSAASRTYRYTVLNREYPSTFLRGTTYFCPRRINVSHAHRICNALVGKRDFSSFQCSGSERTNSICEIYEACCWSEGDLVYFQVKADAFLRGMVRSIIGTIFKLHDTNNPIAQLYDILDAHDRSVAGPSAPAHGLSLIAVKYHGDA